MTDEITTNGKTPEHLVDIGRIVRYPWPHVGRVLQKDTPKGYVYAIRESGSNMVFIGWGGRTPMKETLARLQKGNPRPMSVLKMLLRYNVHDALCVCKLIYAGLIMYRIRGNWYNADHKNVIMMFDAIDPLNEHSEKSTTLDSI
jgi:hypothetical protein